MKIFTFFKVFSTLYISIRYAIEIQFDLNKGVALKRKERVNKNKGSLSHTLFSLKKSFCLLLSLLPSIDTKKIDKFNPHWSWKRRNSGTKKFDFENFFLSSSRICLLFKKRGNCKGKDINHNDGNTHKKIVRNFFKIYCRNFIFILNKQPLPFMFVVGYFFFLQNLS